MTFAAIAFLLMFVFIAPQTRTFVFGLVAGAGEWITKWAPISYIILAILVLAPLAGFLVMQTGPVRVEEGNPMAKYRKDTLDED